MCSQWLVENDTWLFFLTLKYKRTIGIPISNQLEQTLTWDKVQIVIDLLHPILHLSVKSKNFKLNDTLAVVDKDWKGWVILRTRKTISWDKNAKELVNEQENKK